MAHDRSRRCAGRRNALPHQAADGAGDDPEEEERAEDSFRLSGTLLVVDDEAAIGDFLVDALGARA